jgi:hypothetical protein
MAEVPPRLQWNVWLEAVYYCRVGAPVGPYDESSIHQASTFVRQPHTESSRKRRLSTKCSLCSRIKQSSSGVQPWRSESACSAATSKRVLRAAWASCDAERLVTAWPYGTEGSAAAVKRASVDTMGSITSSALTRLAMLTACRCHLHRRECTAVACSAIHSRSVQTIGATWG